MPQNKLLIFLKDFSAGLYYLLAPERKVKRTYTLWFPIKDKRTISRKLKNLKMASANLLRLTPMGK
jgi:23S rRNA A2030 N6-methylase RlmJ